MDEIFDLIGSLDENNLEAATRDVNVTSKVRQEKREDEEMLAALTMIEQASSIRMGDIREPNLPQHELLRVESANTCNKFNPLCDDKV